jgi:ABC-2 type transport system permease protein
MVAHLIALRFRILGNSLKKSPWQIVATVLSGLYGLGFLLFAVVGLFALSFTSVEIARTVSVLVGAAVLLGWILLPLIAAGVDQTIDPARLAVFPIPLNTLLLGLTASGVLGVAGIVTSIAALSTALTWWKFPLAAVAAVVCAVIGVLTCVVGSRMIAAVSSNVGTGRRAREARGILLFIPLILLGPIIAGLSGLISSSSATLPAVADAVAWTPLGAIWAVPGDLARGDFAAAGIRFLIGLATLVIFAAIWRVGLARALETPARASTASRDRSLGLFSRVNSPTGAVAARSLIYWLRDPRYAQSLILVPLVPVLLVFYSVVNDEPAFINAAGPVTAVLLALSIFTDVSYDNTAFALHLQTGVSGAADRLGRVISLALFAVPITLIFTVGSVWYTGAWAALPALLGLSVGALLTGFGISSVISGRWAFMVPAPGESPFKSKPGGGMTLTLSMFATWSALGILCLPEFVFAVISFVTGDALFGWISLVIALLLGSVLLVVGVRWGGRILDQRGPELLVQLERQK